MRHPFFTTAGRPLVFAHRGGAALAPENTIAACDNGLAVGADGLELDVHLSRDGQVVLLHDDMLPRTTNLAGPVGDRTAAELGQADAGFRFRRGDEFPFRGQGIGVPTLAAVLQRYPGIRMIIELKVNTFEMAQAAVDVVRRFDALARVCFGSSSLRVLKAVRQLDPAIATSAAREEVRVALYRSWCRWPIGPTSAVGYAGYQVPERSGVTRVVSRRFVDDSHAAGLAVQVWTIDQESDARRLLNWGVDALITDRPDVIVPLMRDASR